MENWGLITYRETNLLYDPDESASSNKQRVAAVIAHELVHQVRFGTRFIFAVLQMWSHTILVLEILPLTLSQDLLRVLTIRLRSIVLKQGTVRALKYLHYYLEFFLGS